MTEEKKETSLTRSKGFYIYIIIILMFVEMLDTYCTLYPTVIPSKVIAEFLSGYPENVANSIFAFCIAIASIGTYFVLLNQFLADRTGRKILLAITVFGMGFSSLLLATSTNIIQYTIYLFMLYIFFSSDIWTIYISEECPPEKRGQWNAFVLMGGIGGALALPIFRSIFITETFVFWRGMTFFAIFLGIPLSIIILLTFKETVKYEEIKEERNTKGKQPSMFRENMKILFKSARRKELTVILVISFIAGLNYVFFRLVEAYFASSPNMRESDINIVIYITSLSVVLGYLITGIAADKWGRKPLLYIYALLSPISVLIVVYGVTFSSGIMLILIVGLGAGIAYITLQGIRIVARLITVEITPTDARGTGSGLRSLISAIGTTVGLFVSSVLISIYGLAYTFIVISLPHLIIIPLVFLSLKETRGTDLSEVK
ncbi:MAG: MFS transporter [Candidatus Lokiarchaeota archaeon]|nr:MFS transporter [Candidatus Lokiarchaeota archaeon]MBD3337934.1 MFS transporter [Candidatus Lokiarchaeota archaeon]